MTTTHDKLIRCRVSLVLDQPFYGSLLMRMRLRPINDAEIARYPELAELDTMATDGASIFYSEPFVDKLPKKELIAVLAHEMEHVTRLHHTRRQKRHPMGWNIATDETINEDLTRAGFTLPDIAIKGPPENAGLSAEARYKEVMKNAKEVPMEKCGGAGEGNIGGVMEPRDGEGNKLSPAELNEVEQVTKQDIAGAYQTAKSRGKVPGHLADDIEELLYPTIAWTEFLRRFFDQVSKDDYSWSHPNRRYLSQDMFLPGRHSEDIGEVVIAVDTSGSMSLPELQQAGGEIKAIFDDVRPSKIWVVYCDAQVSHVDEFERHDEFEFARHGGGGTSFEPVFQWVDENLDRTPKVLLYFTDMCGSFPDDPGYPTVWLNTDRSDHEAPFGETVKVEVTA